MQCRLSLDGPGPSEEAPSLQTPMTSLFLSLFTHQYALLLFFFNKIILFLFLITGVNMSGFAILALGQVLGAFGDLAGGRLTRVAFQGSSEQMLLGTSAISILVLTVGCFLVPALSSEAIRVGSISWWLELVTQHPARLLQNGLLAVANHLAEAKLFESPDGATLKVRTKWYTLNFHFVCVFVFGAYSDSGDGIMGSSVSLGPVAFTPLPPPDALIC